MNNVPDQAHRLAGAPSFRDPGGHATGDGGRVRHGRLFRSHSPATLTNADIDRTQRQQLRELPIEE